MKNKKALSFILLTVLFVTANVPKALAQQYDPEKDFEAEIINNGKEVKITGYVGLKQIVQIPPYIQSLPVTRIGEWAFAKNNPESLDSITIPDNVTEIENGAFSGCTSLAEINIPKNVTSIGEWAFYRTGLTKIDIPSSVTTIVNGAFLGCTSLTAINVAADNTRYSSTEGVLYNKNKTILIQCPGGKTGAFTIPNTVTIIRNGAFRYCRITKITIPNSVNNIEEQAFSESELTGITIPNSVIIIRDGTFDGCESLASVTIPNSVTKIGDAAFQACGITGVTIPAGVTSIGTFAFSDCAGLTSVTFQGKISSSEFNNKAFDGLGDLRDKYLEKGPGKYTRANGSSTTWTRQ